MPGDPHPFSVATTFAVQALFFTSERATQSQFVEESGPWEIWFKSFQDPPLVLVRWTEICPRSTD